MKRFGACLKVDIMFQFRNGFYYIYLIVCALYIVILRSIPSVSIRQKVAVFIVFTDPAVIGFFFIGAVLLLEKQQGILASLFVTPMRPVEYVLAKLVSFVIISVITGILTVVAAFGISFNLLPLIFGLILGSLFFTLFGFVFAVSAKSVPGYFTLAGLMSAVFFVPFLGFFEVVKNPLFYVLPTRPALELIAGAFEKRPVFLLVYAYTASVLWVIPLFLLAYARFKKKIIRHVGESV